MTIRVRKDETAVVVEILETEFDTAEQMAIELIKKVAELLCERESYAVGLDGIAWWGWWDARSAGKAAESIGGRVGKVYPSGPLERRLTAFSGISERGLCPGCKHPWPAHIDRPWREGTRKTGPTKPPGCCVLNCPCEVKSEKEKAA